MSTLTPPLKWHGACLIILTNGGFAAVDEDDYERLAVHQWYRDSNGYVRRNLGSGECSYLHREALPGHPLIDHKNKSRLDNRKSNLRPCTKAQNAQNARRHRDRTTAGPKGVYYDPARRKWVADIMANGVRRRLGRFPTESEAAAAYSQAAKELHREFANGV